MLIKMPEAQATLYRRWLEYYERTNNDPPYVQRTYAFFNSKDSLNPPLM